MKNVLVVMPLSTLIAGGRSIGGVDSVCQNLLAGLVKNNGENYNYEIIAFNPFNDLNENGKITVLSESVKVIEFNDNPKYGYRFIQIPGILWQNYVIWKAVSRFKPEIFHTHLLSWQILHRRFVKTVSTLHSYKKICRISRSKINNLIFEKLVPILASRNVLNYTAVSHWLKAAVSAEKIQNISVIYNPLQNIYLNHCTKSINKVRLDGSITLVTCGVITKRKGIHHAISVLHALKQKRVHGHLNIIGGISDVDYHIELKNIIFSHGLDNNVTFHGRLPARKITSIYANSDYGLFLSSEETFGLVPLEMLACGLELISTQVGIMEDAKDKFASLGVKIVDNINILEISEYIITGKKCSQDKVQSLLKSEFSPESIVQQYENLYDHILNVK